MQPHTFYSMIRKAIVLTVALACGQFSIQAQDAPTTIKVLSFNILHGATTKGDFDLEKLAQVIKDADPDFVALQEVDYQTKRARQYDLVTELGWRTKMSPLFARAMYYDGGEYGEGVLSKTTYLSTRNVPLPYTPGNEPRSAAAVTTVLTSGDTITFVGTHLDHLKDETDRIAQAKEINAVFKNNPYPTVLAGDLNATPDSKTIAILKEVWTPSDKSKKPAATYPSTNPTKKIDYVMFMPKKRWKVLGIQVIADTVASDHCAYLATLQLVGN